MPSIPVPESEYIEKYGALPTPAEKEELRAAFNAKFHKFGNDFDDEWAEYWRNSDRNVDMLERLYLWWHACRLRIHDSGVERTQARASSDN